MKSNGIFVFSVLISNIIHHGNLFYCPEKIDMAKKRKMPVSIEFCPLPPMLNQCGDMNNMFIMKMAVGGRLVRLPDSGSFGPGFESWLARGLRRVLGKDTLHAFLYSTQVIYEWVPSYRQWKILFEC